MARTQPGLHIGSVLLYSRSQAHSRPIGLTKSFYALYFSCSWPDPTEQQTPALTWPAGLSKHNPTDLACAGAAPVRPAGLNSLLGTG